MPDIRERGQLSYEAERNVTPSSDISPIWVRVHVLVLSNIKQSQNRRYFTREKQRTLKRKSLLSEYLQTTHQSLKVWVWLKWSRSRIVLKRMLSMHCTDIGISWLNNENTASSLLSLLQGNISRTRLSHLVFRLPIMHIFQFVLLLTKDWNVSPH